MKFEVQLPWPDKILNPNSRAHWAAKSKAVKKYRDNVAKCCLAAQLHIHKHSLIKGGFPLPIEITFFPPDKRKRDLDNMIASFKSGQDGIADITAINDCHFEVTYSVSNRPDFAGVKVQIGVKQ